MYYRQASHHTAKDLEDSLGKKSEWADSRTEHEGSESRGASEREVAVLTAQAIKQLEDWEIIGFHHNLYPFQARRMEWWRPSRAETTTRHDPTATERASAASRGERQLTLPPLFAIGLLGSGP